jgi:endoglucanase
VLLKMKFILALTLLMCGSLVCGKTQYRGFTVQFMDEKTLTDAVRTWNINQVRYMMCPVWRNKSGTNMAAWEKILTDLPAVLDRCKKLGIAVVLDLHQLPDDNRKTYSKDADKNEHLWWYDPDNLALLIKCWKQVAEICKDRDQVIWFDLYNEPLDSTVVHTARSYAPALPEWMQKTIDAIRTIDRRHPIVVEPGPGMLCWGFTGFPALKDPVTPVIYSVHMYQPVIYTHQGVHDTVIYGWPGRFNDHGGGFWDKKRLEQELAPAIEFQKLHHARIYVGEFSVSRWSPNAADYLRDCIEIFEKYGWDWNYHAFNESAIWSLEDSDYVDLCDKKGKYVKTGLADPNSGLTYLDYSLPQVGKLPKVEGFTGRRGVMKKAFDKNTATKPAPRNSQNPAKK